MDSKKNIQGYYTNILGKSLAKCLKKKQDLGIRVYYDHGNRGESNVCAPTPFFGEYSSSTTLANTDIAIVDENNKKVMVLCEIEENGGSPKKIIGDVCTIFLAEKMRIEDKDYSLEKIYFILGINVNKKGRSSEKVKKLRERIPKIIKPELLDNIEIKFISGTDCDELIRDSKKEIYKILKLIFGKLWF